MLEAAGICEKKFHSFVFLSIDGEKGKPRAYKFCYQFTIGVIYNKLSSVCI